MFVGSGRERHQPFTPLKLPSQRREATDDCSHAHTSGGNGGLGRLTGGWLCPPYLSCASLCSVNTCIQPTHEPSRSTLLLGSLICSFNDDDGGVIYAKISSTTTPRCAAQSCSFGGNCRITLRV